MEAELTGCLVKLEQVLLSIKTSNMSGVYAITTLYFGERDDKSKPPSMAKDNQDERRSPTDSRFPLQTTLKYCHFGFICW